MQSEYKGVLHHRFRSRCYRYIFTSKEESVAYFVYSYSRIASIKRTFRKLWQIVVVWVGWEAKNEKCGSQKLFKTDQVHVGLFFNLMASMMLKKRPNNDLKSETGNHSFKILSLFTVWFLFGVTIFCNPFCSNHTRVKLSWALSHVMKTWVE